jgi:glycosyltransferase involved in cell wall biosynthesis
MMNGTKKSPLVSIGLAVYNGERYLEEAITSILAQTYENFELIISDNASTDRTQEICAKFTGKDPRVKYFRNKTNIGGANNHNLAFSYAKGEYFRLAAHDDVLAPELVERCVEILETNPDVVLCHSITILIDEHGRPTRTISRNKAQSARSYQRLADLTGFDHDCEEIYGVMRTVVLRKTGLLRNYTDADRTLLAEISLYGKFYQVLEPLFYKRVHPEMSTRVFSDWRQRMLWFGEEYRTKITLPHWNQLIHYIEAITKAPIAVEEKFRCYMHMLRWVFVYRRWRTMGKDLVLAVCGLYRKLLPELFIILVSINAFY